MKFAVLLTALILGGCTTVTSLEQAKMIPVDRVYMKSSNSPKTAKIVVIMDSYLIDCGGFQFYLDGTMAALLNSGERFDVAVEPGSYNLGVKSKYKLGLNTLYSIDQNLKEDKEYYYRLLISDETVRLQRFDPTQPLVQ